MDERILELTEKIYQEGILKAGEEASVIIHEAKTKAEDILAEAEKKAEEIISKAGIEAAEIKKNTHEEIKQASHQAINSVKQKIAELITLKITEQPLKNLLDDKTYISGIISQMVSHWEKSNNMDGFNLEFPVSMLKDTENMVLKTIQDQFGQKMNIGFSQKIQSGFRISPIGSNYIISFTEQDFSKFFSQFLRPKTIQILYNDDAAQ
jgi:V/A-type H+-transporting ATPase subunit E